MTLMKMGYERLHCLLLCSSRFDYENCNKTLIYEQPLQDVMQICNDAVIPGDKIGNSIKMCSCDEVIYSKYSWKVCAFLLLLLGATPADKVCLKWDNEIGACDTKLRN
jgi:hypothetical protein